MFPFYSSLFFIKFEETTQIIVAFVATTLKALLPISKTSERFSRHKFCTGNINNLFGNIFAHISSPQYIKKCGYRSKPHQKRKPQ